MLYTTAPNGMFCVNTRASPLLPPRAAPPLAQQKGLSAAHLIRPGAETRPDVQFVLRRLRRGGVPLHGAVPLLQRRCVPRLRPLRRGRRRRRCRLHGVPPAAAGRRGVLETAVVAGRRFRGVSARLCLGASSQASSEKEDVIDTRRFLSGFFRTSKNEIRRVRESWKRLLLMINHEK